jgi:uncharacterized membrane protein
LIFGLLACINRVAALFPSQRCWLLVSLELNHSLPASQDPPGVPPGKRKRAGFADDFKRFFLGGLKALLPTLITLSVLIWIWNLLWDSLGRHIIYAIKLGWYGLGKRDPPAGYIGRYWSDDLWQTQVLGVLLAIVAVYIVGLIVGNLIGRAFWKVGERLVMKIPVIRAIYPAVKQITDFVLADQKSHFQASRVVAVRPHEGNIWSLGLVTGTLKPLDAHTGEEMLTIFLPNSPAAFSGYVLIVPRSGVVELPMGVDEAMRLLVSGGVIEPGAKAEAGKTNSEVRLQKAEFAPKAG